MTILVSTLAGLTTWSTYWLNICRSDEKVIIIGIILPCSFYAYINMKNIMLAYIVMRFEVYFRCYRYLGGLLNLFNFISIINHLWHMGDRYLVTRTPDRMLRHWGCVQMDTTYMGMFWGKTLWFQGIPFWIKQHWNGPYEFSSPLIHRNIHINTYTYLRWNAFSN